MTRSPALLEGVWKVPAVCLSGGARDDAPPPDGRCSGASVSLEVGSAAGAGVNAVPRRKRQGVREMKRRKGRGAAARAGVVDYTLLGLIDAQGGGSQALRSMRRCLLRGCGELTFDAPCGINDADALVLCHALCANPSRPPRARILKVDLRNVTKLPSSLRWLIDGVRGGGVQQVLYPTFLAELLLAAPPDSARGNTICGELHALEASTARNREAADVDSLCKHAGRLAAEETAAAKEIQEAYERGVDEVLVNEGVSRRVLERECDVAYGEFACVCKATLAAIYASPHFRFICLVEQGRVASAELASRRALTASEARNARRLAAAMLIEAHTLRQIDMYEEEDNARAALEMMAHESCPTTLWHREQVFGMGLADECPDPEEIGRAGWTVLHTTAAAYPERPTQDQKRRMWDFMNSWSHVYPCTHCATHMRVQMKKDLPDVSGKRGLSLWTCRLHNEVNARLGKEEFPCEYEKLLERWHPTYPHLEGTDQPGGLKDLPSFTTQKQHAAAAGDAPPVDPGLQSLMDMSCSAFCPKDEKKKMF